MAFDEESGLSDIGKFDVALFDNVSFSDDVSSVDEIKKNNTKSLKDNVSSVDDYNRSASLSRDLSDNITSSDNISKSTERSINDSVSAVDDYNRTATLSRSFTDSINVTDVYNRFLDLKRSFDELISIDDITFRKRFVCFIESISADDTINKLLIKSFTDSSLISDNSENLKGRTLIDFLNVSDHICLNKISGVISTIQDDFHTVLTDIMNEEVKLVKQSVEMTNGFIDEIAELEFCITCRIMPISQKDRNLIEIGNLSSGNMIGYFYPSYEFNGTDYIVDNDDIINDLKNSVRYRVVSIVQREHLNNKIVYVKAVLQRI